MLTRIKLNNFQCYKDVDISFTDGVNVIVGCSHTGKTSILRALYWVLFNQPAGDSIRRHDTQETSVCLHINNLQGGIKRAKGNKTNKYILINNDKELEYSAVGMGKVPDDISDILNIQPINVQKQMDEPFLLSKTPGEVMRMVNKICNLERMDSYVSIGNSDIREINSKIKNTEESIEKTKEKLKQYSNLKEQKVMLYNLIDLNKSISEKETSVSSVENILTTCMKVQKQIVPKEVLEEKKNLIYKQTCIFNNYKKNQDILNSITSITQNIHDIGVKICMTDTTKEKTLLKKLINYAEILNKKKSRYTYLTDTYTKAKRFSDTVVNQKESINVFKKECVSSREQLAKETCPTCRQKINPNLF